MYSVSKLKMRSWRGRFNTFLTVVLGFLVWGCATTPKEKQVREEKKEVAALRIHLEANEDAPGAKTVSVLRSSPVQLSVERDSLLDERDIKSARLMETPGGFLIVIECTFHGRMSLEAGSVTRMGRHMAIASTWATGDGEHTDTRWLAAPLFRQALRDGIFSFTPDCSLEEARHIVRGLNNVAVKLENQPKPGKKAEAENATPSTASETIKAYKEAR